MKTRNHILASVAIVFVVLTSGCVKLWKENLDIKTYMVETQRAGEPRGKVQASKLWVDEVTVLPPYNVRNLVLRKNDVEFETSYYTELLLSPSENFRNNFYAWFADSGLFEEIGIAERMGMTHRLVVTVMKFHGDMEAGQAVLKIKVTLLDEETRGIRVLLSKDYEKRIDLTDFTADHLVRAYNQALTLILTECESDIAALF